MGQDAEEPDDELDEGNQSDPDNTEEAGSHETEHEESDADTHTRSQGQTMRGGEVRRLCVLAAPAAGAVTMVGAAASKAIGKVAWNSKLPLGERNKASGRGGCKDNKNERPGQKQQHKNADCLSITANCLVRIIDRCAAKVTLGSRRRAKYLPMPHALL